MKTVAIIIVFVISSMASHALGEENEQLKYQKAVEKAKWLPPESDNCFFGCVANELKKNQLEIAIPARESSHRPLSLRILDKGKEIYRLECHSATVFFERDDVLYFTDFMPTDVGCTVEAFDLKSGKSLWRSKLFGVSGIEHSLYSNRVRMEPINNGNLVVYGDETFGRYIELVDMKTGKAMGHKVFPKTE